MSPSPDYEERTRILVDHARSRREGALEALYRQVAPALYGWAHLRMRSTLRARVDPEEVAQETWLRAIQRIDEFDPERAPFRAWILTIARYVLIEASRATLRGGAEGRAPGSSLFARQPDPRSGVSTIAVRNDALVAFLERVGGMDEAERELVVLRGLEGRPFDEIGARLGLAPDTAGKRWRRLRERIAQAGVPDFLL